MPTKKPRVTVTLSPYVAETISRLAQLQGVSRGYVIADLIESVHPPLMRTVALLEAAIEAPEQVRSGLMSTIEELERELESATGANLAQMDWLTSQFAAGAAREPEHPPAGGMIGSSAGRGASRKRSKKRRRSTKGEVSTPVPVTRGSGFGGTDDSGGSHG